MNKRQARQIARIYVGKIAQQDDAFFLPELSNEELSMITQEIDSIGEWLLNGHQVDYTQADIVNHVMGTTYLAPDRMNY